MQFIASATLLYTRVVKSVCDMFIDLRHFGGYNPTYSERVAVSIERQFSVHEYINHNETREKVICYQIEFGK